MKRSKSHTGASAPEMFEALLTQKERYEDYFASQEGNEIDHRAEQAYTGLLKTLIEVSEKLPSRADMDAESVREEAERILRNEYGINAD